MVALVDPQCFIYSQGLQWISVEMNLTVQIPTCLELEGKLETIWFCFFIVFKVYLFILRESVCVCERRERGRGAERERISSRFRAVSAEPDMELKPMNCEIVT